MERQKLNSTALEERGLANIEEKPDASRRM